MNFAALALLTALALFGPPQRPDALDLGPRGPSTPSGLALPPGARPAYLP